jgi:transcriptional regulator with XRE-family HTH domain
MNKSNKLTVRRVTVRQVERTTEELAELRATRERFQREKPSLEQVLAATGRAEAVPLGEYLQTQDLLHALRQERDRQGVTLTQLAERTGYDPAVLSRLFTGRQANTTLTTVGRIANALGKVVVHTLCDLPAAGAAQGDRIEGSRAPSRRVNTKPAAKQRTKRDPSHAATSTVRKKAN